VKDIVNFECINDRFSTTRRLTRTPKEPDPCFQLPAPQTPKLIGGLRTRGLYKAEGPEPIVTVVTIAYNCASSIEETMLSVLNQTYSNIEYVVIDGGSTDGTVDVIRKYEHAIDYWVSEPDRGIYDAMNKGIRASTGQWLNMMNVKDVFFSNNTIQIFADKYLQGGARFVYSDMWLRNGVYDTGSLRRHVCDHTRLNINHQGSIYQKSLHLEYGPYIVAKGVTISDYLFFSLIDPRNYLKADEPIAVYDTTGISGSNDSVGQRLIVDYLLNGMPRYQFLARFHLLSFPKQVETFLVRLVRLFKEPDPRWKK
jgi:glycosyltransferase involved in cell wall biosynthesis